MQAQLLRRDELRLLRLQALEHFLGERLVHFLQAPALGRELRGEDVLRAAHAERVSEGPVHAREHEGKDYREEQDERRVERVDAVDRESEDYSKRDEAEKGRDSLGEATRSAV